MIEIGAALSSAKSLYDAARVAIDARDDAKLKSVMIDLQGKLFDAMQAAMESATQAMAMQNELRSAQDELAKLKAQTAERNRYALTVVPGQGKQYAYASQPGQGGQSEPPHYLCQACYDKGIKAVLQSTEFYGGDQHECPSCHMKLYT